MVLKKVPLIPPRQRQWQVIALSVTLAVSFTQQFPGEAVSLEDITRIQKKKIQSRSQ